MKEQSVLTKENYEWVWNVRSVRTARGERVPMEKGDQLFICMADTDNIRFHHRTTGSTENSGLWNKATGKLVDDNNIEGGLPDGTSFTMTLAQEADYHRITCKHVRNPEQGQWDADDEPTR